MEVERRTKRQELITGLPLYKSEFDHPIFVIPKFIEHHQKIKLRILLRIAKDG